MGGWRARKLFFCPQGCQKAIAEALADRLQVPPGGRFEVTLDVYEKLAYGDRRDGILAVVETVSRPLPSPEQWQGGSLVVVEGIEKPGNLGAIFRSAEAAGIDAVVIAGAPCDPWNPNVIRASLGTVFTVPFYIACTEETVQWCQKVGLAIVAADPSGSKTLWEIDLSRPVAIVLGAEHSGLSSAWRRISTERARIPMCGRADSLNVSVAAALFMYEALRQRAARGIDRSIASLP